MKRLEYHGCPHGECAEITPNVEINVVKNADRQIFFPPSKQSDKGAKRGLGKTKIFTINSSHTKSSRASSMRSGGVPIRMFFFTWVVGFPIVTDEGERGIMARIMLIEDGIRASHSISAVHRFLLSLDHKVTMVVADEDHLMTSDIQYDIAVIDVGRARGRGCAIASRLRALNARLGILLLSGDEDPSGIRITGLQSGADFCEPKPPMTSLLRTFIDAILRRVAPQAWSLDTTARTLRAPHLDAVPVNPREMALLKLLADSSQHAADRCAIAHAFGIEWVGFDERVLEKTVSRLRRKWRDGAMCDLPLRTMHGVGYCFTEKIQIC